MSKLKAPVVAPDGHVKYAHTGWRVRNLALIGSRSDESIQDFDDPSESGRLEAERYMRAMRRCGGRPEYLWPDASGRRRIVL